MFFAFIVLALVFRPIFLGFDTKTVLKIVFPFSLIRCSILMQISSKSMSHVFLPAPIKFIARNMIEDTLAMNFVVFPKTFISGTVWPCLYPKPMFISKLIPLTFITCAIISYYFRFLLLLRKIFLITLSTVFIPIVIFIQLIKLWLTFQI